MANIYLLIVCLIVGVIFQKIKAIPDNTHVGLNQIILHLSLPATILISVPALKWDNNLFSLVLMPWLLFAAAFIFFSFIGKKLNWPKEVTGCLILTAGLGNTSFVGFPVLEALYGPQAVQYGVLIDQPGTFFICSTVGIWLASSYSDSRLKMSQVALKVFFFAPFMAFLLGLLMLSLQYEVSGVAREILIRIAGTLAPLALVSIGFQLRVGVIRKYIKELGLGLLFKLILAPLMIYFLYALFGVSGTIFKVAVLEAAMATMVTASIIAATSNLRPMLAGLMVGVGVPLSALTLFVWYIILN